MKTNNKKLKRWQHPNQGNALTTSNHLAENMPELVSREDAMEAAVYWQRQYDKLQQETQTKINAARTATLDYTLKMTHLLEPCK